MSDRPRTLDFRRLGDVQATDLDLPASRARSLRLLQSWRRIAGEAITRRTAKIEVRRGVLEVSIEDRQWSAAMRGLLPRVSGRLATECPELELRAWRLAVEGEPGRTDPVPIVRLLTISAEAEREEGEEIARPATAKPPAGPPREASAPPGDPAVHLRAVAALYLDRRRGPSASVKTKDPA